MLNLPNLLTLFRILTIPFFLGFLAYQRYLEGLVLFIIGGVTDFLDGLAARMMKQKTALGTYLDPVADKLMVFASYAMLSFIGGIPLWFAVVVISRDVMILLGYGIIYLLVEERMQVAPSRVGKCSTMLQLLTLGIVLALLHDPALMDPMVKDLLIGVTTATTVISGLQYLYRGLLWLQTVAPTIDRLD